MKKEELQKAFDEALGTESWELMPPVGCCWTEHKFSFIDAIIRACDRIFVHSRKPMAREFYVPKGGYVRDIVNSLPGFYLDPQYNRKPYLELNKSSRIGTLNGAWSVYADDQDVLPRTSSVLIGEGGSYRIEIVRHDSC